MKDLFIFASLLFTLEMGYSQQHVVSIPDTGLYFRLFPIKHSSKPDSNAPIPLYVVDGELFPKDSMPLKTLNPSHIIYIQVLTDNQATSVYGDRGMNGAILVATTDCPGNKWHLPLKVVTKYIWRHWLWPWPKVRVSIIDTGHKWRRDRRYHIRNGLVRLKVHRDNDESIYYLE